MRTLLLSFAVMASAMALGGADGPSAGTAQLRLSNTSTNQRVSLAVNDTVVLRDVSPGQTSGYVAVRDSSVMLTLRRGDKVEASIGAILATGRHYTATTMQGADGHLTLAVQADSLPGFR